ncbi:hypothetical protein CAPTEDRAFT_216548 [Capitella teleta]|uniref:Membrane protein BRI3 n=1 Tax=Capitella teleta TaxID=283909 RepID=R7UUX3_CAPTE|nr:hypothetical protein CAPTEDRAFT_216548 [Capitella teleta]|eukprot:ELU07181.1 hypothetical protein CAPTEDRAFT_216548 [Capitella teleta]
MSEAQSSNPEEAKPASSFEQEKNNEKPPLQAPPGEQGNTDQPPSYSGVPGATAAPYPPGYTQPMDPQAYPPMNTVYGAPQSQPPVPGQPQNPTMVTVNQPTNIVMVRTGNCPHCGIGTILEEFTIAGIFLGIFFFPCGMICCYSMRRRRCSHCSIFIA